MDEDGNAEVKPTSKKPALSKWFYIWFVAGVAYGLSQSILHILADDDTFTTPQIVYDVSFFLFMLIIVPAFLWQFWSALKPLPVYRDAWERWPLAACVVIGLPGGILFAFLSIFPTHTVNWAFFVVSMAMFGVLLAAIPFLLILAFRITIAEARNGPYIRPSDEIEP